MELVIKKYKAKDMIFNNGIVNLYRFLTDSVLDIESKLSASSLTLTINKEKMEGVYLDILQGFLRKYRIVHQTKNDRWFFDEKKKDFILDKRFDVIGKSSGNDVLSGVYHYKTCDELGIKKEDIQDKYLFFCKNNNQQPDLINGKKISNIEKTLKLKKESDKNIKFAKVIEYLNVNKDLLNIPNLNNQVVLAITLNEGIEKFTNFFIKGNTLKIDSKIHTFENGQDSFQDMTKQAKNYTIDKWDALIYWFGGRIQRLYNYDYFIYPNSSNLEALAIFKEFMNIYDNNIEVRDDKNNIKTIGTNIDFYKRLSNDGINNKNFYISNSEEEFKIKFFMYLFSTIYHIEEQYEKANKRRKATKKELYDTLWHISFVAYTVDGDFKTSFNEYTKTYQLIKFFEILKKEELFDYLANILVTFSMSQGKKEVNLNIKKWCQKLLSFSNLRKEYYLTSFNILKNNSKSFGNKLFKLEEIYLKQISGEKNMTIHEKSKKLGDGIGHYCVEIGDKDLLFKLRNIKNYKQLISYFKDLKFSILKNDAKARFSKEFNDALSETLEDIESSWEIVRDYVAIYAIDKYRSVAFAKSNKGNK